MELPAWHNELIETLHRNGRGRVLKALLALGGEATSSDAFERAGVPNGSKTQFLRDLERRGLIRENGAARGGRNQQANVYRLTDEGQSVAEDLMSKQVDDPLAPTEPDSMGEFRSALGDLKRRVAYMEEDMYASEEGQARVSRLREQIDELEARLERVSDDLSSYDDWPSSSSESESDDESSKTVVPNAQTF